MTILITKNLGRYNLCSDEKNWCVSIRVDDKSMSATWPSDDEPDIDGLSAGEIVRLIIGRINSYWISTGRERDRQQAAQWLENEDALNRVWAEGRIVYLQKMQARTYSEINSLRNNYLEAEAA